MMLFNLFVWILLIGVILCTSSIEDTDSEKVIASYKLKTSRAERPTNEEALTFWVRKLTSMGLPLVKIGAVGLFLVSIFKII